MKKFKTMICAMAAALFGFAAQAQDQVSFVLNIDDASHVSVKLNNQDYQVQTGDNPITVAAYTQVEVKGVEPYAVKSVTDQNGTSAGYLYSNSWSLNPGTYDEGKTFSVVTVNLDEARTGSFTVKVDEASMVTMTRMNGYQTIALSNGDNTVKIDPSNTQDRTFSISNNYSTSSTPLYQVKVNDVVKAPESGGSGYQIMVSNGDVVDITAKIPEVPATCTFTYGNGAEGCVQSVLVNGEPAEIVDGKLSVMTGQKIQINFNMNDYAVESFKVNGTSTYAYSAYECTVMGDIEFAFEAHKYATINATVKVSDPEAVTLYRGYSYNNDVIALTGEEVALELSENNSIISWSAKAGCYINGVTVNGQQYSGSDYTVKEGDVIEIDAAKIVMDRKAVVWINDRALASTHFNLSGSDRNSITIADGYNVIDFYAGMTPFRLSWYDPQITSAAVYVNNEEQSPNYSGTPESLSFTLPLQDGDVVKIFYNETPVECTVNFTVAAGAEAEIVADRISKVDPATPFTCFKGTEIAINPGKGHVVKVNGADLTPVDGVYTATVADPATNIEIAKDTETSISEIGASAAARAAVYDLSGRRVAKAGRGLYIVNGKKVVR